MVTLGIFPVVSSPVELSIPVSLREGKVMFRRTAQGAAGDLVHDSDVEVLLRSLCKLFLRIDLCRRLVPLLKGRVEAMKTALE